MKKIALWIFRLGLALMILLLPVSGPAQAAPRVGWGIFTVNTANDSNTRNDAEFSLREAIQVANGTLTGPFSAVEQAQMAGCIFNAGLITNACGGGNNTIQFAASLTEVALNGRLDVLSAVGVIINGQVNAGRVVLNSTVRDFAFFIAANYTTVKNFTIINASSPIMLASDRALKGTKIFNNYLGVTPGLVSCSSAPIVRRPDFGFILFMGSGSAAPGEGTVYVYNNVLGCATADGIYMRNVSFAHIGEDASGAPAGNWIGLDPVGGHALPNGNSGVRLVGTTLTKTNRVVHNIIANNLSHGVSLQLTDPVSGNTISGNTIRHNQMAGIKLDNAGSNTLATNIIHDNGSSGIWLSGASSIANAISGGEIYANGAAGITEGGGAAKNTWVTMSTHDNFGLGIDKGDNGLVDAPPLTIDAVTNAGGVTTVSGTYTGRASLTILNRIHLYRLAWDASGYGEGRSYVGSATLTNISPVTWQIIDPAGPGCYTAVVTEIWMRIPTDNNSSEFSKDFYCQTFLPMLRK